MSKRILKLTGDLSRRAAKQHIDEAADGQYAIVQDETRTLEQNAMLHPLLTDISKQKMWMEKRRSMLQWKVIMVSAHAIATGAPAEMVIGIEGEVVNLRESTAAMSTKRFSSLIEYVIAFCVENDIRISNDKDS